VTADLELLTQDEAQKLSDQRIASLKAKLPDATPATNPATEPPPAKVEVERVESPAATEEAQPAKDEGKKPPEAASTPDLSAAIPEKFRSRAATVDPELLAWMVKDGVAIKSRLTQATQEYSDKVKALEEANAKLKGAAENWNGLMADAEARATLTKLHESRTSSNGTSAPTNWADLAVTDPDKFNAELQRQLAEAKSAGASEAKKVVEETVFQPRERAASLTETLETWSEENGIPQEVMAQAIVNATAHAAVTGWTPDKWTRENVIDGMKPYVEGAAALAGQKPKNGTPSTVPTVVSPSRSSAGISPPVLPAHERAGTPWHKLTAAQKAESAAAKAAELTGAKFITSEVIESLRRS